VVGCVFAVLYKIKVSLFGKKDSDSVRVYTFHMNDKEEERKEETSSSETYSTASSDSSSASGRQIRKKIIEEDEGEYVDFEEIKE
jgi:hypothetical protein